MTLRNAFEELTTEGTLRRLLQAVSFARDANDRMRVVVDSGTISGLNQINWGQNNGQPNYYGTGSPNSMDMRDMYRMAMRTNAMMARHNRWTFT